MYLILVTLVLGVIAFFPTVLSKFLTGFLALLTTFPTIKKEFSLPSTPEYITPVKKVKFKGLTGKAAKNKFGTGGKQQIKILEENYGKLEEFFDATKTTKLPQ
jgi:hypothetical protein